MLCERCVCAILWKTTNPLFVFSENEKPVIFFRSFSGAKGSERRAKSLWGLSKSQSDAPWVIQKNGLPFNTVHFRIIRMDLRNG